MLVVISNYWHWYLYAVLTRNNNEKRSKLTIFSEQNVHLKRPPGYRAVPWTSQRLRIDHFGERKKYPHRPSHAKLNFHPRCARAITNKFDTIFAVNDVCALERITHYVAQMQSATWGGQHTTPNVVYSHTHHTPGVSRTSDGRAPVSRTLTHIFSRCRFNIILQSPLQCCACACIRTHARMHTHSPSP